MKTKNKYRYLLIGLMLAFVSSAVMLSCKGDDPTLAELRDDKLAYLADSLRVSDSLRRLNQAGVVNYAITVVSGSTSTLFKDNDNSRTSATQAVVANALVTISQFGKAVTDTTDVNGMVVIYGFFRGAVNVTVTAPGFTTLSYTAAVKLQDDTESGTINFVGNLVPIFETTGANTATISGVAKIQSDLTNTTRENVPDGTTITAHIDAKDAGFKAKFLTPTDNVDQASCGCETLLIGDIKDAAYSTGIIGTITAGAYSITVPAAIDGLPIKLTYSDIALNRVEFTTDDEDNSSNRTLTQRAIYFGHDYNPSSLNGGGGVDVDFLVGSGASATARISQAGTVESVTITNGGTGYSGTPTIQLNGGGGTGATAVAVVSGGQISAINVTAKGSGYTSSPTVAILSGINAAASVSAMETNGTVLSVNITNSGSGYTSAPTVTFAGGGAPTTIAQGTAIVTNGRVTSITVTNPGAGYTSAPTVGLAGGGFTNAATATSNFSGISVAAVQLTNVGSGYTYPPSVTFAAPTVPGGVRAAGTATIDAASGTVTGIVITNVGSGYTGAPGITLTAGSGATATALLTGGGVIGIDVTGQGSGYTAPPTVLLTGGGGSGATATATVVNGHVTGLTIVNAGVGYTGAPTVQFLAGEGARGVAVIGTNGAISSVRITTNGSGYTGAPVVSFDSGGVGSGATGTATIANNQVSGVTMLTGGSGYVNGNTPGADGEESFEFTIEVNSTTGNVSVKPAIKYINDIYWGTGQIRPN